MQVYKKTEEIRHKVAEEGDERVFTHKGYTCLILRPRLWDDHIGLCGYVVIPEGHWAHGLHYDTVYDKANDLGTSIQVHGGLTYSNEAHERMRDVIPDGTWVLGFDCSHLGDVYDIGRYFRFKLVMLGDTYKTMDYVEKELRDLVDALDVPDTKL